MYRQLLEVVRREEILIEVDLEELNENNAIKEKFYRVKRERKKRILIVAK